MKVKNGKFLKILTAVFAIILTSCSNQKITVDETCSHKWGEYHITTEATCTTDGVETRICSLCGETETKPVVKTGHDYSEWTRKDDEFHTRSCVCGETETKPHNWNNGEITTPATHDTDGVKTFTCYDCNATKTEPITKTGHNYTCVQLNENEHKKVCDCGDFIIENHYFDEGTTLSSATHTQEGQIVYKCLYCGYNKYVSIPKLIDHIWSAWGYKDANNHERSCECGETQSEAHDWDDGVTTTPATHTSFGVMTYTCSVCKGTKTQQLPKLADHNYSDWQQNNAETHKKTCECGEEIIEAHTFGEGSVVTEASGSSEGTIQYTCSACGYVKTETYSNYEIINNYVFKNLTGTETTGALYPFSKGNLATPIYATTFSWNQYYDFADVDLTKYSEVFFYYKETSQIYPAFFDSGKNISYYDMGSAVGDTGWQLFKMSYDETSNTWSINSSFVKQSGFEIANLSNFKLQTGGSTPAMQLSPLYGLKSAVHSLPSHTIESSGYSLVQEMPLDLSTTSLTSYKVEYLLANTITTFSNFVHTKDQVANINFKEVDDTQYEELKFYFRSLNKNDGSRLWFELGKKSESSYSVYASNSESWNEIRLSRNLNMNFDVYANGTYKCEVSSFNDLRVKIYGKQLISGLFGKAGTIKIDLVSNKTTSYQIIYHESDSKYGKHSAELLAKTLNSAVESNIFVVKSASTKPSDSDCKVCVGTKMAELANLNTSNVKGLNYKISALGNCLYIYGDVNFGTHNGVKHFLKNVVNYEYYYKGVETYNTNVSNIVVDKKEIVSETSFLVGYDVNAETRSDAGYTWNNNFQYSFDSGFIGDGVTGKYHIGGQWHNEAKCATDQGITLYQTSIRSNPQKHMDLTSSSNASKVASWLNTNYYSKGEDDVLFCLMDDYSWYNTTDEPSTYSPTYFNFINMIAQNLDSIVSRKVSLVAVAYHQTFMCPTNWTPFKGKNVSIKVYLSPAEAVFAAKPDSKYNDLTIKMQDDIADNPRLEFNPYRNMLAWSELANANDMQMFVYLYDSLPNYFAPFLTVEYMLDYYKLFKGMNAERLYDMGQYDNANATDWTRLKTYLKGKLTDNCNITKAEFDQLVTNFFNAYYGAAGQYMKLAYDKEFSTITNPVAPGDNDYDRYYGKKTNRSFPLYLRGYYYNEKKVIIGYQTCYIFDGKNKDGIMDYYDQALAAVKGDQTLTDRVKLDGLALRYWYWGCNDVDSGLYGAGSKFGFKNARNETFEQIIADAKVLGVTQWGEGVDYDINHAVKG